MIRFAFLLLIALVACGVGPEPPAEVQVQLALNWFPEAEHGGFYAASLHGYYQERGVEVDILAGGPGVPVIERVATGAVAFGITNADNILAARAQQIPVVALMAPYQISPRCIMVHANSGITSIADIANITLAMSQSSGFSQYLRWKYPFSNVEIVPYPGNVTQFLANENFAQQGYIFSEPYVARARGGNPRALLVADIGYNPYTSVLITTEDRIAADPQIVEAVVQASVQGWEYYLDNPDVTNRHINTLNAEIGLDILAYGAEESRALVLDPIARANGLGSMTLQRWQELLDQMVVADIIPANTVIPSEAFTNLFLP